MQLMEDIHLVENRGRGIDAMLDATEEGSFALLRGQEDVLPGEVLSIVHKITLSSRRLRHF
jgi:hypothetical protein